MRVCLLLWLSIFSGQVLSADAKPQGPNLAGVGITPHLDAPLPLNATFRDETGRREPLSTYFGNKPVLLAPVYFTCPMLCSQTLSGVVAALRPLSLQPGRDFEVVALSFDPHDMPERASKERLHYSHAYSSKGGTNGWHFLVGSPSSIRAVMNAIGFQYRWDAKNQMFIHPSGIMLLTPAGRLSRYFYGVNYEPKDIQLGLVEGSAGRIGSAVDQFLLLCYHYDATTGKYGATVITLLQAVAALTIVALCFSLTWLWRRERMQGRSLARGTSHP